MTKQPQSSFLGQVRISWVLLRLAARLIWRASPWLVVGVALLLVAQTALVPLQLVLSKAVLDRLAFDLHLAEAQPSIAALPLGAWVILAAASVAIGSLFQPVSVTFQAIIGDRLTVGVAEQIMQATNRWSGIGRFEDPAVADDLERSRAWANHVGLDLLLGIVTLLIALLTSLGMMLVLLQLHGLIPLFLVLATLPQMARRWDFVKKTRGYLYAQTPRARQLQYSREATLSPELAKDVRLYGLGSFFQRRYDAIFEKTIGDLNQIRRRLLGVMTLTSALATAASGAVYLAVVWLITQGQATLGDLALYGGAATILQAQLLSAGFSLGFLPVAFDTDLKSLFRILEAQPDLPMAAHPRPAPRPIKTGIVFERVVFTYPGSTEPILRDVTFAIRPGECVALVGHNGAGKTTIVKLLLRLYDPTAGRILLDGIDLRDYDLDELRGEMGVIFQDFVRYKFTVGENIGLGRVAQRDDLAQVQAAAARGGATELIAEMLDGLDTQLGTEFGGRELSGGQWQKLALGRAFMRDSQLLVLDEPTAALDVQTEYDLHLRFHDLTRDRMTLLVSHRFSTVRMADQIIVIQDGHVVEVGNHMQLMAQAGLYARLYTIQASSYLDR